MPADEQEDKIPVNFIIKVYETKALAEEGDELNALYVFDNGIDNESSTASNPTIANGSQFIQGTTTSDTTNKLVDSAAKFGSRLLGKTVQDSASPANTATITAVDSSTQLTLSSDIMGNSEFYSILEPGFYYTYTKYFYRIEASDVVAGFVIDWDDGEDNSEEKANRQTIMLDYPNTYAVVEHTYTKHGKFFPMIKTISVDGFHSKYYSPFDRNTEARTKSLETQPLGQGQNDFSIISLDLQGSQGTTPRIPSFAPANYPPTAILKVDRKSVFSGIDNDIITATNLVGYAFVPRAGDTLTSYTDAIEVIYETTKDIVLKETIGASSALKDTNCIFPSDTSTNGNLTKVLSVKIIKLSEGTITSSNKLGPDERVHIMLTSGTAAIDDDVVTTVSLGNPLQTLDRPGFSVLADGSYSQTKNSNVSISTFMFDTDKLNNYSTSTDPFIFPNIQAGTDVIGIEEGGTNLLDQIEPTIRVSYAHKFNLHAGTSGSGRIFKEGHLINNDTKRFYDFERCIKLQVEDSSASTRKDSATFFDTNNQANSGSDTAEAVDDSETAIDVDDGTDFAVNQVIAIDSEFMLITSISTNTLTVVRGYQDTTAASHNNNTDIFILANNGKYGDGQTFSQIKHYRNDTYKNYNTPTAIEAGGLLLYANNTNPDSLGTAGQERWTNRVEMNSVNYSNYSSSTTAGDPALVFGNTGVAIDGSTEKNKTELSVTQAEGHTKRATNYVLVCQEEKFEKLFFRMSNNIGIRSLNGDIHDDVTAADLQMKMTVYYAGRVTKNSSSYEWKPLPFVDTTTRDGKEASSLNTSGHISFEAPDDWGKIKSSDLPWSDTASLPVIDNDSGSEDPHALWTDNLYGILIAISANLGDGGNKDRIRCNNIYPADTAHSSIIKVVDPHHKSLNDIAITQNITLKKSGKYTEITDRFGRSEIRKIGANGGKVTFGGVELNGEYATQKKLLNLYQRKATPVYLDIERTGRSNEFLRVYGVITSMSEDYPVGLQHPKFGIEMSVEFVSEFDSNGAPIGEGYLMSLGGEILDEPKYLL